MGIRAHVRDRKGYLQGSYRAGRKRVIIMTADKEIQFEALYGPLAAYTEYRKGAIITYRGDNGLTTHGKIVWVTSPVATPHGEQHPMRYIVKRDGAPDSMPEIVYPSDIIA